MADAEQRSAAALEEKLAADAVKAKKQNTYTLKITLIGARNLRNADWGPTGISDPYAIATIENRKDWKFKTKVQKETLNPVWNESCEVSGIQEHNVLRVDLWDEDP